MGIRLNKHKPNIYFKVSPGLVWGGAVALTLVSSSPSPPLQPKKGGGISFNSTVTLTQCSEKLVQLILHEYSILPEGARPQQGCIGVGVAGNRCPGHPEEAAAADGAPVPLAPVLTKTQTPAVHPQGLPGRSPAARCCGGQFQLEGQWDPRETAPKDQGLQFRRSLR